MTLVAIAVISESSGCLNLKIRLEGKKLFVCLLIAFIAKLCLIFGFLELVVQ
ncbi:hypothetical protein AhnVgp093 [Adoxophyes honmai nucleopolyhedrovirus]|uniref:Uncharacterized protein n=1 Tax=Adoxophyes honmai nucleopolyhedrovirus TaxID=224399 RepID=Q80LK3_NPVAH|nr:hypothetical protein AhnVgp093 [Adoxophyes honmai nucleopolyhedrovirus]BAC67344.1 hypothetical protein [Adoxophyes honmai nucleopolyhedrovirus]